MRASCSAFFSPACSGRMSGVRSRRPAARSSSRPGSSFRLSSPKWTRKPGVVTQRSGRPGPARRALGADPAGLHQRVDRSLAESDSPDLFDFGAGHRLVIGNHRKSFHRRPRQLAGDRPLDPQAGGKIGRGAKRPPAGQPDKVHAAPGVALGQLAQQPRDIGRFVEVPRQSLLANRFGDCEQERLDETQLLRPPVHAPAPRPCAAAGARLRR